MTEASYFDEKEGKRITTKLMVRRLCNEAIPSQFPNCPAYLSTSKCPRESPESRRIRLKEAAIQTSLNESRREEENYISTKKFSSLAELHEKLHILDLSYWTVTEQDNCLLIYRLSKSPHPKINHSVVIDVMMFCL